MRFAALLFPVAIAAAAPGASAAPAPDMVGSVRMALLRSCGTDPACQSYAPRAHRGTEPLVAVDSLDCRDSGRKPPRIRRCTFALKSPRRASPLSCGADFHAASGDPLAAWSDRKLMKARRVYLPTGSLTVPRVPGASTLRCSGNLVDYARKAAGAS